MTINLGSLIKQKPEIIQNESQNGNSMPNNESGHDGVKQTQLKNLFNFTIKKNQKSSHQNQSHLRQKLLEKLNKITEAGRKKFEMRKKSKNLIRKISFSKTSRNRHVVYKR